MSPELADIIQKLAATFAFAVGGAWVLMNYVRNRTHVPRLQIELRSSIVARDSRRYLLAAFAVKNPGLSVIRFPPPSEKGAGPLGSGLQVSRLIRHDGVSELVDCEWEDSTAFEVLVGRRSIEPGLVISEEKLLQLPDSDDDAFLLKLRVAAHGRSWIAVAVAHPWSALEGRRLATEATHES